MELTVARIDRAQGLRGEVAITVRTDDPAHRFVPGASLKTEPTDAGPLTIAAARTYKGRWYVRFDEVTDRDGAEALRGILLLAEAAESLEDDAWYTHELEGLDVVLPDGTVVGTVVGLEQFPAQDMLVVAERPGGRTLIPFVRQIVPSVDVAGRQVVIDPPGGLLERDQENLEVVAPAQQDETAS